MFHCQQCARAWGHTSWNGIPLPDVTTLCYGCTKAAEYLALGKVREALMVRDNASGLPAHGYSRHGSHTAATAKARAIQSGVKIVTWYGSDALQWEALQDIVEYARGHPAIFAGTGSEDRIAITVQHRHPVDGGWKRVGGSTERLVGLSRSRAVFIAGQRYHPITYYPVE